MGEDMKNNETKLFRSSIFAIGILFSLLFVGSFAYSYIEGWTYLDSLYFTVVTLTTIGYGDIIPKTVTGKVFTMFFSFFGIAMVFYFFSIIGKYVFKNMFEKKLEEHHDKLLKHIKENK
ncbi:MAG: potassium channel family protein [Nanoarchaeota archaeon]|nr:potassium channel family protein [Nanoarchaeota archaeon]MBU4308415.1 potassium channel family protein [Nanoarchaeota archaeon]